MDPKQVCIIGSGNWGSAVAKIIGENVKRYPDIFAPRVPMWVHEEWVNGEPLTAIINRDHENVKYLKGVKLPDNVFANSNVAECCQNASIIVMVVPHQFLGNVCNSMHGHVRSDACAISLIKGLEITQSEVRVYSHEIERRLGIPCAALSGANIASEVALEKFSESTIGCEDLQRCEVLHALFDTPYFSVQVVPDPIGVQLCGALKNVVAIGAGLCDGLGYGSNTKAAIIRRGLLEMRKFGHTFFGDRVQNETFFESCGVGDLITTCSAGRNRKVAEAFAVTRKPIHVLEDELLQGQKLQGTLTAREVHGLLSSRELTHAFPFFTSVYRIVYQDAPMETITHYARL